MIQGEFNSRGELFFEVGLLSADGEIILVMALLDTGFTGWLAIDSQDADSLGWVCDNEPQDMQTAQGEARFNLYEATFVYKCYNSILSRSIESFRHLKSNICSTLPDNFDEPLEDFKEYM